MQVTVWTLAADTDANGTAAEVFTNQHDVHAALIRSAFHTTECVEYTDAIAALNKKDYTRVSAVVEDYISTDTDRFRIETHQLEIAAPIASESPVICSCGANLREIPFVELQLHNGHQAAAAAPIAECVSVEELATERAALTPEDQAKLADIPDEKQAALDKARETQNAFWEALNELETVFGIDIDGSKDLSGLTVEDLEEE